MSKTNRTSIKSIFSFVTKTSSKKEDKVCLNEAIVDVANCQDEVAKPLLKKKKYSSN